LKQENVPFSMSLQEQLNFPYVIFGVCASAISVGFYCYLRYLKRRENLRSGFRKRRFTESFSVKSGFAECPICLDAFLKNKPVAECPCRHLYHIECIQRWLKEEPTCPVCKASVQRPVGCCEPLFIV